MKTTKIKFDQLEIATHEMGDGSRPQLVCIHGGMGLGSDSLISGLTPLQEEFDLLFVDLRGCGKSSEPVSNSYELSELASDIAEILRRKPAKLRGVFGHSLGGMIAIELISRNPELVSFAILANSALDDVWQASASEAVEKIASPTLNAAASVYSKCPTSDKAVRTLAIEYGPIYFPELNNEDAKRIMSGFSYRGASMTYTSERVYPGMNLRHQASSVQIPTLLIAGELDVVVPVKCQEVLAEVIPLASLEVVRGAGHFPFISKNSEFVRAVTQWYKTIKGEL